MSEHHEDEELEDESDPVPFWQRRKVQLIGLAVVLLLAFVFTRGKSQHKQDTMKSAEQYIGVVVPYQPAQAEEQAAPAPGKIADAAPAPPPPPKPKPPAAPVFRIPTPPGVIAKPVRPAMLS
jgi:outer membrane biosynthesis protein TonB